jgi:hypothetical protein
VRWGPTAREGQGGEKIVRNCEDWRLGEELTGEWRTVAALGRNPSEGGAYGGRRRWSRRGLVTVNKHNLYLPARSSNSK